LLSIYDAALLFFNAELLGRYISERIFHAVLLSAADAMMLGPRWPLLYSCFYFLNDFSGFGIG
jgi:hypothetical protein